MICIHIVNYALLRNSVLECDFLTISQYFEPVKVFRTGPNFLVNEMEWREMFHFDVLTSTLNKSESFL